MLATGGRPPWHPPPRLLLILTENWTMRPTPDVADLVRFAVEAERAGIDGVMVSEHIVLGPSADEAGQARRQPARRRRSMPSRRRGDRTDAVGQATGTGTAEASGGEA